MAISPRFVRSTFRVKNSKSLSGEIIGKYSSEAVLTLATSFGSKGTGLSNKAFSAI